MNHPNPQLPLTLRSVTLSIAGQALLSDINLTVSDPGVTAILGHNGAGKSLLLKVLHGLSKPHTGTVHWATHPVSSATVRQRQSMVFQKPVLLRRSVAANLDYALALPNARSNHTRDALLELASLSGVARQQARTLSGGQQQRLAFVRALATGPDVMFLDEPTANLDPDATAWIEHLINTAREQSIKVFLVTHDIAQARRLSQDVIFVRGGRIEEHTASARFFTKPNSPHSQSFIDGILPALSTAAL
jgi:tungstate transport system ATP-binding protein